MEQNLKLKDSLSPSIVGTGQLHGGAKSGARNGTESYDSEVYYREVLNKIPIVVEIVQRLRSVPGKS